jgi:Arc/MetJ-type ribon-helix-helix transcriptional regulator
VNAARRKVSAVCILALSVATVGRPSWARPQAPAADPGQDWIARSNGYTQLLLDVTKKHSPETASAEGLAQYDEEISQPTKQDEDAAVAETKQVQAQLTRALETEPDKRVRQDLSILLHSISLSLRNYAFNDSREVPYENASEDVFEGLRRLLDDQVAPERRHAALIRLRKYAGVEAGYKPLTEILKQRDAEQIAKPNMIYPAKVDIETELSRNRNFVDGIPPLFKQYGIPGWEEPHAKLKTELENYDAWVRSDLLPKSRTDFREPPEQYALNLESYGIDIPIARLEEEAHHEFKAYQAEMQVIAAKVAAEHGWKDTDYRSVCRRLKLDQISGDAVLPFYKKRLGEIEQIITKQQLVTLPDRPARIRLASAAESSAQPAPHMVPPPLLNNHGEQGEFVLPLNLPPTEGEKKEEKYDDFSYDAVTWTLISHEARPGHELQFDSMIEHGVSLARALYAFNSTNVEGWGLYAEYIMKPYMPLDGQLISLQMRLQRAARAFLDPELQSGKIKPEDAMRVLTDDVNLSIPFAKSEVERYTFRAPGQANSYFYGYTRLLQLRRDTEKALGTKFNQKKFHDFILSQGLLPPALMRRAVFEDFVPTQKAN